MSTYNTLTRVVLDRASALKRERILRSAVEETLREIRHPDVPDYTLDRVREICQGALAATEATR